MIPDSFYNLKETIQSNLSNIDLSRDNIARTGALVGNNIKNFIQQLVPEVENYNSSNDHKTIGINYINDRVIVMKNPSESSTSLNLISSYFKSHHPGHYLIWNFSEKSYDYSLFDNQVIEFHFPGFPFPPLDSIFSICNSIDHWIQADPLNIAAIHCQNGRGRTISIVTCYLAWSCHISSPQKALKHISNLFGHTIDDYFIPSQYRFISYFSQILDGNMPSPQPLLLQRIILSHVPGFESDQTCRPYLQIFRNQNQNSKMIFTSTISDPNIHSYSQIDESIVFHVNMVLDGDVLIRIRHMINDKRRVSMLRVCFHTGFLSEGIFRLKKNEIDGACDDHRFADDFFLDFVFSNVLDEHGHIISQGRNNINYWQKITFRPSEPLHSSSSSLHSHIKSLSIIDEEKKNKSTEDEDTFGDLDAYISEEPSITDPSLSSHLPSQLSPEDEDTNPLIDDDNDEFFQEISKELEIDILDDDDRALSPIDDNDPFLLALQDGLIDTPEPEDL